MIRKKIAIIFWVLFCAFLHTSLSAQYVTKTIKKGSAIIDMGSVTPTVANSLKPYGLIYLMLSDRNVPVYQVINQSKSKDGIDFTHNGKSYSGGTFIIPSDFFRASVTKMISAWAAQGVIVDYAVSDFTVDNVLTYNFGPKWVMDSKNGSIAIAYLNAAGIPSSAFSFKAPSELGGCDDIFVLPHADPTWDVHKNLFYWNRDYKGNIWVGCNAVSILENITAPADTVISGVTTRTKLNFLSTNGLVLYSDHQKATPTFITANPNDPVGQYMGLSDAAQQNGAESIYLPKTGGGWNASTKIINYSPSHPDIPGLSPGQAVKNIYGRAFNDASRGYVAYQASHNFIGTGSANVAAIRMFLNFSFFSLRDKAIASVTNSLSGVPSEMKAGTTYTGFDGTASGNGGPFTYQWLVSIGGTFSNATSASTSYTPDPAITSSTAGVMTCIATDACGRKSIASVPITILPGTPPLNANTISKDVSGDCPSNTTTFNVFDSNVDANAGSRTLTAVSGFSNSTVTFTSAGSITYTSNANFKGTETGTYTISNGSQSASGTLNITVGNSSLAPSITNDALSVAADNITVINVLSNDKTNSSASDGSKLYIRDITGKPTKGYVYINKSDGTLSYLTKSDTSIAKGTDTFKYLACNDVSYCSEGTVTVTITQNTCASGQYKAGLDVAAGSLTTLNATLSADTYISNPSAATPFGSLTVVTLNAQSANYKEALLKFDVSSISTSTTITSAILTMTLAANFTTAALSTPFPASVVKAKQAWKESEATYNKFDASTGWGLAGAKSAGTDYTTNSVTQNIINTSSLSSGATVGATVTDNVQSWVTTPSSNNGFLIIPAGGTKTASLDVLFNSNEAGTGKPTLTITYPSTPGVTYSCTTIPTTNKPIAYPDTTSTKSNTAVTISPLTNDVNYYGSLTARNTTITGVTVPNKGTATFTASTVVYTPNGSFVGTDTLTYTITDATNNTQSTATIRVNVTRVAPLINADNATTPSGTSVTINVGSNDSDPQGDMDVPVVTGNPKNGTVSVNSNNIIYVPSKGFVGKDTLIYQRSNISNSVCVPVLSDTALVIITITNQAPVASNDTVVTYACVPVDINVKANDSDPEGKPLTPSIVTNPTNGTVSLNTNGTYRYTPNTNFTGTDQFTYRVKDGSTDSLISNTATVVITVSAAANPNQAPVAVANSDKTLINQEVNTDVLSNDSDPNNDALTISITASGLLQPSNGTIQLLANNMIKYTPNTGFIGTDTYEYQITDSHPSCSGNSALTAKALVTIKVTALPILVGGTIWDDADGSAAGTFTGIQNGSETGTNSDGSLYLYLVDSTNTIIDQTSVDAAGKYLLVNVPTNTSNLRIILSAQSSLTTGDTLSVATLPGGYVKTSPIIKTFTTATSNISNSDFGIGQLPVATPYSFATRLNPGALTTVDATKITGTDADGSIVSIHYTSFPTNISSIVIGGTTYTASSWPSNGVTVAVNTSVSIFPSAGSVTAVLSFRVIDNSGSESALPAAAINVPFYVALSAGTISGGGTFCSSGIPSTFTSTTDAAGGQATIAYQWQSSTVSNFASSVTDISGATSSAYTASSSISTTTYFRRKVSTASDAALYSNILTVTINPVPSSPTGSPSVSLVAAAVTISATASGGTGTETVDWYDSQSGGTALVSGISGSLTTNYTTPVISNTTAYFATARNVTTGCVSISRTVVTATISGTLYAGVVGSDQSGCGTFTPTAFTSVNNASGLGGITYQWQSSTTSTTSGFANIAGATSSTYSPSAISSTTYYRRVATSGSSFNSNVITMTANPIPDVPTGSALNAGRTGAGTLQLTGTVAAGVIIDWYNANTGSGLLLSGANNYTTPSLTQTTTYYPLSRNITTGCISERVPAKASINATIKGGSITSTTESICGSGTPGAMGSSAAATGGTGTYTYQWQSSSTSSTDGFTDISGENTATFVPSSAISITTYYRRAVSTSTDAVVYSNVVTVTVKKLPLLTISPSSTSILIGGTGQTLTASGADSYTWSPVTGLSSSTQATIIANPTATTIYTVTGNSSSTSCSNTVSITVTVTSGSGGFTAGAIAADQTICIGATPAGFTSSIAASGGTGTITYQWQRSTDNVTFTDISGATSSTYSSPGLAQKTYYRRAASTSSNPTLYTGSVVVNVVSPPAISGGITGRCAVIKDSLQTYSVTAAPNATNYVWILPNGWSGTSTTNSIVAKVGSAGGTISVTPYNGSCAGNAVTLNASIIDHGQVTLTGLPVTASGNNNSAITVTVTLYDVNGNRINCSGGTAIVKFCENNPGTFTPVVDNNDGTYTTTVTASANTLDICGTVGGPPILNRSRVTFTGPQGSIKASVPQLVTETPKLTFTMSAGRAPFTVIYKSARSTKTDTLTNYASGTVTPVALIPATTLYTLVSIIDANGERRDNNFTRDTASVVVLAPKVIITLKADQAKPDVDSTWITILRVRTKNIGDLDLSNSQAKLDLNTVFPNPVTFKLDSIRYSGNTITANRTYDGISANDLFARLNNRSNNRKLLELVPVSDESGMGNMITQPINGVDGVSGDGVRVYTNKDGIGSIDSGDEPVVVEDGHSIYMFGPQSYLPIGVEADIVLYLHVKPNGYTDPFVMQAVALGTGNTDGATALTTSISNDNNDINSHPEITKQGDPIPTVINLFPRAVIGSSLNAGTPVLQGNGSYNVPFTLKLKNYGNLNLQTVQVGLNLLRSIGLPSTFSLVGPLVSTGDLLINASYDGKVDTNMLASNSILGYNKGFSTITFTINIVTNQLSSIYRLQATAYGFNDQLNTTVNDLSNDGLDPDPDGNNIPSEKIKTIIAINLPIPPLVPGKIGIRTASVIVSSKNYCEKALGTDVIVPTELNTGGTDPYEYQWQSSTDNITFTDIVGSTDSTFTSSTITASIYIRRQVISGNQFKYSNAVYLQILALPAKPVISSTSTLIVGKGNATLTSTTAPAYTWSTGETSRSIVALGTGIYIVRITDANGCSNSSDALVITALDPYKVADLKKVVSKVPVLQSDGSFILGFTFLSSNLRSELLDSVKIKDDLSKVFPSTVDYQVTQIQASGKLKANALYNGNSQIDLLSDVSQLPGLTTDSVQVYLRVSPNGFSGKLNNTAVLTANSPFGTFSITSNDPTVGNGVSVRNPTPFTIPLIDIFIPSGFSPNHDGVNDNFVIIRPFGTTINMEIFNRWGNAVYKAPDYKNEWDGRGNQPNNILGEMLPDGTYYYVVTATDKFTGGIRKFAGFVTLKR